MAFDEFSAYKAGFLDENAERHLLNILQAQRIAWFATSPFSKRRQRIPPILVKSYIDLLKGGGDAADIKRQKKEMEATLKLFGAKNLEELMDGCIKQAKGKEVSMEKWAKSVGLDIQE